VVSRRAVLLGGGAALLASGCGKDLQTGPPPAVQALLQSLGAERALAHDLDGSRGLKERIRLRALDRARRLASAVSAAGGGPHDVRAPDTAPDASAAPGRAQAALEAHVAALPSLTGSNRSLGTDLVAECAADAALLGAPGTGTAFPGTPT
jgi:hypothetical protein